MMVTIVDLAMVAAGATTSINNHRPSPWHGDAQVAIFAVQPLGWAGVLIGGHGFDVCFCLTGSQM